MDLEFLTSEQLELTLKLSDMLSMEDLPMAATVLASYDWNIDRAMNEVTLNKPTLPVASPTNTAPSPTAPQPVDPDPYALEEGEDYDYQMEEEEGDYGEYADYEYEGQLLEQKKAMFEQEYASLVPLQKTLSEPNKELSRVEYHRRLAGQSKGHRKAYLGAVMEQSEAVCRGILAQGGAAKAKYDENRRKVESNLRFINFLHREYHPRFNFTFGTFFLNLTRAHLERKHLLVYVHSETQAERMKQLTTLIMRQPQIARLVNEHCVCYGMFDNADDYEAIQKYLPLRQLPAFALFRMDLPRRREQFVAAFPLASQGGLFMEWLAGQMGVGLKRRVKPDYEKQEQQLREQAHIEEKRMEEAALERQKKEEEYVNHSYIRAQQDELWEEMEKTYHAKRQLSKERREELSSREAAHQARLQQMTTQPQPEPGENTIEVRFRMPLSGETKTRRFRVEDKVERVFEAVDGLYRDEFEEKFNDFDLKQSFPPISLQASRDKTLAEVFEGSSRETIIIREL